MRFQGHCSETISIDKNSEHIRDVEKSCKRLRFLIKLWKQYRGLNIYCMKINRNINIYQIGNGFTNDLVKC